MKNASTYKEPKNADDILQERIKEISEYKYALDESCIVAITDQKGIIQHANDNFCKISKYSREELIGQDHRIINSGHHPKDFIRSIWTTIANGKIWRGELKNKAKDGTIYWVDTTIVPFLNEEGKPYQYIAIRADITERKRVEENLEKSLKEITDYKYALDESSIIAITDQKGIIQHANDNFCKISKYSRGELIGQDHRIINSGHHPKEFIRNIWATIAKGKIWRGELKNKAKDGTIYWVDTTIVPFLNQDGKPYQYVAIRSDITERKKLEEQHALFADIVNSSDDAIFSKNLDGVITSWNHGAEKVFGYTAEEIIGKHISILVPLHHRHEEKEIMEKIYRGFTVEQFETSRIRKDGKVIDVTLTVSPMKDSFGNIIGASKVSRDMSEKKANERNRLKSDFLANMSHELRTPMNAILGFSELLIDKKVGELSDKQLEYLNDIHNSGSHLLQLINNVLDLSKIESGKTQLTIESFHIAEVIEEVINVLKPLADKKQILITLQLSKVVDEISVDKNKFRQILYNLVSNAIKFNHTAGSIVLVTVPVGEASFLMQVTDNGIGISKENQGKLFTPFMQLDSGTTRKHEGSGLGLALTKSIVELQDGTINVESEITKGTTFSVTMPLILRK
jgi:PAS domain S-box-containing protein